MSMVYQLSNKPKLLQISSEYPFEIAWANMAGFGIEMTCNAQCQFP